ncbi:two-component system, LytT family, sensor kinase [Marinitoga hydrogenitolerans DSM 16785]|uniref:histidine kinase n=1 Tax=Marinitoga hydrogenitolerans (strain DSM 16785 / JCM 12826 / AT1271) TaxID=1122195 RepID=A0A1M4URM5_MARH1|nr:LytS/YhcK type 5TM receptor domain-containing protein [Marinitoga hydrogenitolerans]SHE59273.1 two-component system, LytT family, sensor kinase [Marinitoga hydrogenitolerans DSM 16785]
MLENISLILLERVSLILVITYIIFQTYFIKEIFGKTLVAKNKIILGIIGGLLGILGTIFGVEYNGAIVNYRDIGVILAGMLGGIPSGIIAALISSIHRLFIGGITAVPCFFGTLTAGIISGLISQYYGRKHFTFFKTLIYTIIIEIIHLTYVLVMVKPFDLAYDITFNILFPMVITNALGISFLNFMILNMEEKLEFTTENTINSIFIIMEMSLNTIEKGFNEQSAKDIANVILNNTDFEAVSLTDKEKILAHVGIGEDHHYSGLPIRTEATKKVIKNSQGLKIIGKKGIKCEKNDCPLYSAIIVPIKDINEELIGTLKLYYSKKNDIKNTDIIFGKKLAQILSLIISTSQINEALKLATEEKLRELMANLSPHFLFNTLNAIKYISKSEPEKVNKFIDNLSDLLRYTLYENSRLVSIKKEIEFTINYLELMKLRFKDKLDYIIKIDDNLKDKLIPPFILQPIVENSIKHGMKEGKLIIEIIISEKEDNINIVIKDNGKGFLGNKSKGKGLKLIRNRLESLYGYNYSLSIKNAIFGGTEIEINLKSKVGEVV